MLGGQPQDCRGLGFVLGGQLGQAHLPTGGVLDHDFSSIVRRMPEALATSQQQAFSTRRARTGSQRASAPGWRGADPDTWQEGLTRRNRPAYGFYHPSTFTIESRSPP